MNVIDQSNTRFHKPLCFVRSRLKIWFGTLHRTTLSRSIKSPTSKLLLTSNWHATRGEEVAILPQDAIDAVLRWIVQSNSYGMRRMNTERICQQNGNFVGFGL
ncbi:MAG: hypothetical protein [Siphoviridae sp. ctpQM7]|nr:MAG: hypothetical protein [Siphoviridae sp. ctpQM7]